MHYNHHFWAKSKRQDIDFLSFFSPFFFLDITHSMSCGLSAMSLFFLWSLDFVIYLYFSVVVSYLLIFLTHVFTCRSLINVFVVLRSLLFLSPVIIIK